MTLISFHLEKVVSRKQFVTRKYYPNIDGDDNHIDTKQIYLVLLPVFICCKKLKPAI